MAWDFIEILEHATQFVDEMRAIGVEAKVSVHESDSSARFTMQSNDFKEQEPYE